MGEEKATSESETVRAGFGDPEKNIKVEKAAIRHVCSMLLKEGWTLEDRQLHEEAKMGDCRCLHSPRSPR